MNKSSRILPLALAAGVLAAALVGCAPSGPEQDPCNVNPQSFEFDKELTFEGLDATGAAYESSVSVTGTATIHQELKSCDSRAYDPTFMTVDYAVSTPNSDIEFYDLSVSAEDAESDGGVYKNNFATEEDETQEGVPGEKSFFTAEREIPSTLSGSIDLLFDFFPAGENHSTSIESLVVPLKP